MQGVGKERGQAINAIKKFTIVNQRSLNYYSK